ncbi:uncharacterized protein VDAG_05902 [Verticillium dahliae VdLs.17]|uniref:Uncharacterized protein n=1 Tax=Verticillium dahliae (strain VdLs.17 / ATCC MYA-4575 / FGSC 10137) TaxID=498257 RepID=G2X6X0_VERDV|nr:uncharacterized protein VDAG_05902 [Verticillium dahliae VdLs.17]EGY14738.1 hypothetical protein VDAG_05902 [Verticillium dahliae VdLs.17]
MSLLTDARRRVSAAFVFKGQCPSQYQKVIAMGVAFKVEWPRWALGPIGCTIIALTSIGYDE